MKTDQDTWHAFEMMDRASTIQDHFERTIGEHRMAVRLPEVEAASKALAALYQAAAKLFNETQAEEAV